MPSRPQAHHSLSRDHLAAGNVASEMPPRSVTVTYTLHPAPPPNASASSSSSPLLAALEGIRAQTPLTNLHWKPTSRTALRTIQTADVDLVELGEAGTAGKEVAGSVLEWPLTNLCLVMCEVSHRLKVAGHVSSLSSRTKCTRRRPDRSFETGYRCSQRDATRTPRSSSSSIPLPRPLHRARTYSGETRG